MKKLLIDIFVFNKAIHSGKFEVAEFLLEHECPCNFTAYLQKLEIPVLDWLSNHNVQIDEPKFSTYLIEKTQEEEILRWFFEKKKVPISGSTVDYCITKDKKDILELLVSFGYCFGPQDYISASKKGDLGILDILKKYNCPFDETVEKTVLTLGNKQVVKWFINNDFF